MFFLPSRKTFVPPGNSKSPSIMNWLTTFGILYLVFILEIVNIFKSLITSVLRFFFAGRIPTIIRTPETQFKDLAKLGFDFEPHYLELETGGPTTPRMHYLDEGPVKGHIILCLHGEPSWSFLFRKMIPGLVQGGYRVIVPDLIGFGKSDKYTSVSQYTFDLHMGSIKYLLRELNLLTGKENITLVSQDWGTILGLKVVKQLEEHFSSLVIMNTSLPTGDITFDDFGDSSKRPSSLVSIVNFSPLLLWRSVMKIVGSDLPVYGFFRMMEGFSSEVARGYSAPFPHPIYAAGLSAFPKLIPVCKDDLVGTYNMETRNFLKTWTKPALVMFGDRDVTCAAYEKLFKNLLKEMTVQRIAGASHYMQETHGPILSENIVSFLKK
ncbi:haloalkane dehalogenase [Lepeophtheirus salmonis]|nr:haloalkane dehalogenase-like [Lepeophtheirus salmonis]